MESHDTELESELREALLSAAEPVRGDGVRQDVVRRTVARRRRTRRTVRISLAGMAAAAALAVAFLVSSGGGDDDSMRTVDGSPSTSTTTTEPERTEAPATSSTTARDTTTTSTSTSSTSTTPSTSSTSSTTTEPPALPGFPPEFTGVTQGGDAWALYLAVAPPGQYDAPELHAADAASGEAGYGSGGGFSNLACDQGAPEALGRDGSSLAATVYFQTQAQAQQAQAAFQARGHSVVGVVHVQTYCLD